METIRGVNIRSLLARNIRRLRMLADLTQVSLAARAGLTHNFINDIENGKKWISAETIAKLSIALNAEPYQFFLSDIKFDDRGSEILSLCLDDFEDTCTRMVKEYRARYLPDSGGS